MIFHNSFIDFHSKLYYCTLDWQRSNTGEVHFAIAVKLQVENRLKQCIGPYFHGALKFRVSSHDIYMLL